MGVGCGPPMSMGSAMISQDTFFVMTRGPRGLGFFNPHKSPLGSGDRISSSS